MATSEFGLDANKMSINNIIAKWYSHADAEFGTRASELYRSSLFQVQGVCMQSGKYEAIGVAIDYLIEESSIVAVKHAASIMGCQR